jgi:DNA repair protein RadC
VDVYHGSLNSTSIRVAELLRPAVRANAASIILVHNHPSGAPRSM